MARQVKIEILGDASRLRGAFREAERSTTGFGKSIARAGVFAATGLAGIATGVGVAAFKSIQAAQESNKVSKQTEAVLKSTGGAAKVTAKQIGDLATAISNKTGIDDEQIQSTENMILTFTNIRNVAGKNNDIFTQATRIATDMSVALGQDATKGAIQLGKALNDPVKGITALQRVGVTFTQQQRDQIATLVKSGKTLEAQKIILHELGREFGGSAAAAATPLDRLKVIVGNLQEQIGNVLLPTVNHWANLISDKAVPAISRFIGQTQAFWKEHGPKLNKSFGDLLAKLRDLLNPTVQFGDGLDRISISSDDVANKLNATIVGVGKAVVWFRKAGDALNFAAAYADFLGTALHLRLKLAFLETAQIAGTVVKWILNIGIAAGKTGNVIDRFSGGSGHAFDSFVADARSMRDQAERQLGGIRKDIDTTKRTIAGLHAPKLVFTAEDHVNPVVSRIMREMRSRGFSVTARLVRGGTAQKGARVPGYGGGDRHPYMLEGGETVVPKELTPEIAPWAAARGIPGFQGGGLVPRSWPANVNLTASREALMSRASFFAIGFPGGAASGNVIQLALAQAKRMAASFKVALALIEAGIVESGLRNLPYGDRDSLGFLQQRPSQGWLHPMNISYAAWDFLRRAIPIAGRYGTAGALAQAVQRSAFPGRYDQVQARALGVLNAYGYDRGGVLPPGLSLAWNGTGRPERVGGGGITVIINGVVGSKAEVVSWVRTGIREAQRHAGIPPSQQIR